MSTTHSQVAAARAAAANGDTDTLRTALKEELRGYVSRGLGARADAVRRQLDTLDGKAQPVEPTKPVEPVEPTKPVEPVEPTKPVEPVEPTKPVEKGRGSAKAAVPPPAPAA